MRLASMWQRRFFRTWPVAAAALGGLLLLIGMSVLSTTHKAEEIVAQLDQLNARHRVERNAIDLAVSDDAVGLNPRRARGMGLIGIEERVRELHGAFNVRGGAAGGTELRVTLPVTTPIEEAELARAAG